MTFSEAYVYIIKKLESFVEKNNDDNVISILSDIDCDVWNDKKPNDLAAFNDLKNQLDKYKGENEQFSEEAALLGLQDFLTIYKENYGFDLENCLKFLSYK